MLVRVNQALYPHGLTQSIIVATETRHRNTFLHDSTAHYLKIVDPDTDRIIAMAEFHLFPTAAAEASRQDLGPKTWPQDVDIPLATLYWSHIVAARKTMAGIPHVFLSIIATAPGEGRRGAGAMLMQWGCERADELGCQGFMEASPMGVGLYEKWGYRRVGGFEVDIPSKEGEGTEVYRHEVMVRPAKGQENAQADLAGSIPRYREIQPR